MVNSTGFGGVPTDVGFPELIREPRAFDHPSQVLIFPSSKLQKNRLRDDPSCTAIGGDWDDVGKEGIEVHMKGTCQVLTGGRHELAPKVE